MDDCVGNDDGGGSSSTSGDHNNVNNHSDNSRSSCSANTASSRSQSVRRKFRTLTFGRRYKTKSSGGTSSGGGGSSNGTSNVSKDPTSKKRKGAWNFRFNYRLRRGCAATDIPDPNVGSEACVCTGYRRTEEHHLGAGVVFQASSDGSTAQSTSDTTTSTNMPAVASSSSSPGFDGILDPFIDLASFNPNDYPIEDWEERARAERARELEEGVDPPPGYHPTSPTLRRSASHQLMAVFDMKLMDLAAALQNRLSVNTRYAPRPIDMMNHRSSVTHLIHQVERVTSQGCFQRTVHTQVDYIHCLVPDLHEITKCSFYWGKMDRYEAERLLDTKPEGTFLLRDSAQEEYLFSVSFRRYGRSLHARIEQWNHKFSFDSHDPGVFASCTVCGLIEHYKDPSCCLFFEPMLTIPLHRTFPFPLQHMSRAVICKQTTYDGINALRLPKSLKTYLKEYHYKQRVRVRMFELEH